VVSLFSAFGNIIAPAKANHNLKIFWGIKSFPPYIFSGIRFAAIIPRNNIFIDKPSWHEF
jgi:hypothetical protein